MPSSGSSGIIANANLNTKKMLDNNKNHAIKINSNEINQIIKNLIKHGKNMNPHFDPVSVRGVVSRVQTALPSIRIRLRNLRPGFHPIHPKREKCVPNVTPFRKHTAGHD